MIQKFNYRLKGEMLAVCNENTVTLICINAIPAEETTVAEVMDALVKEFRNVPHAYVSDYVVQFAITAGNQEALLADMAGGLEKVLVFTGPLDIVNG